jgi:hypothetical protein
LIRDLPSNVGECRVAVIALRARRESSFPTEIVIRFSSLRSNAGAPLAFGVSIWAVGPRASFAKGIEPAIF